MKLNEQIVYDNLITPLYQEDMDELTFSYLNGLPSVVDTDRDVLFDDLLQSRIRSTLNKIGANDIHFVAYGDYVACSFIVANFHLNGTAQAIMLKVRG